MEERDGDVSLPEYLFPDNEDLLWRMTGGERDGILIASGDDRRGGD